MLKDYKVIFYANLAFFWNLAFIITIIGCLAVFFLPERYMFDAYTISIDQYNEIGIMGSYPFSIWFYHTLGLAKLPFPLIAWIQIPIVFLLLYKLGLPQSFSRLTLRNVLVWLALFVLAIYMGFPSKEFITILWVFMIAFVLKSRLKLHTKMVVTTVLFLFFGWFYREYFILMPLLALGIYMFSAVTIKNKVIYNTIIGLIIVSFMSLSHGLIKGVFITEGFRNKLNTERVAQSDENAATMILSPVKPDTFHGEVFGIVYGFFSVNLPISGLRFLLKPQVILFVLWQVLLFLLLVYFYGNALKNKSHFKHELWVFHLLFAYFIIQGIFEPDLGSAVKHKLGVLPLIWMAIYYDKGLIKEVTNVKRYVFKKSK